MESMDWLPASDEDLIGSATSIGGVIDALTAHGCSNLTPLVDQNAFSEFPLAGGGYCDVYQGALKNGTRIAVKSLRVCPRSEETIDVDRQKVLKRAAREMYYWSQLRHDNVLPLLGFIVFRGHLSMVSEWMHNGNLTAYRNRNPGMGWTKPCMEICAGLCYIHAAGIVHGDLKAANVMVSPGGVAVISDFGNTQIKGLTLKFTSTTRSGISLRWAAPELLLRDNGPEMSKEADVYAYGMTVLEVITGKAPYEGIADHRVLTLVAYEKQPPLRPDVEIPNELWTILTSCWNYEPWDRPGISYVSDRLQVLFQLSHIVTTGDPGATQSDSGFMLNARNNLSQEMRGPALNDLTQPVDTNHLRETISEGRNDGESLDGGQCDEATNELMDANSYHEMNILASITSSHPTSIGDMHPHDTAFDAESVHAMSISGTSLRSTRLSANSVLADFGSVYAMSISSLSLRSVSMSDAAPPQASSQHRWAIADMDDEEFLRQLDARLSGVEGLLRRSHLLDNPTTGVNQSSAELENYQDSETEDSDIEREWIHVRRAMMCVREIVRTEKGYLRHLIGFRDSEDARRMSSVLAEHLPRLIETSRTFCSFLEEDPSARGVSQAFLDAEEQLEVTLVQWSKASGEVISSLYHRIISSVTRGNGHTSSTRSSWIRRRSASQTSFPFNLDMTPVNAVSGRTKVLTYGPKCKKLTEQDIVVAPTSRAIRYVGLYRDLLLHTSPTSASRKLVEQALQAATRIAYKCDKAQIHADQTLPR